MEPISLDEAEKQQEENGLGKQEIQALLSAEIQKSRKKIIVLDDDPTGVQTVHGVSVFTDWSVESIKEGFQEEERLFFLLTNSRGLTEGQTEKLHRELAENLLEVYRETGREFLLISRGDSTLRGHFPLETRILKEVLEEGIGARIHGEILIPFFKEGGRFTLEDIHYVNRNGTLVPAGETEFARDRTFGYTKSDLKEYIEEKTKGEYPAGSVTSISLKSLRKGELGKIQEQLGSVENFGKIIVNALDYQDLEVFCIALYRAMAKGKNYIFRTAASFVKVFAGVADRPFLTREDMQGEEPSLRELYSHGGIIVIGSHTAKTTEQLEALKELDGMVFLEFNSDLVLEDRLSEEVARVVCLSEKNISEGRTVVIYTRRRVLLLENDTGEDALLRSVKISEAVQSLVGNLRVSPAFVIAKGGITSSDIGVKALKVRRAFVLGQVKPGIPVWKTGEESRFPGIPYVIFPGNVGERDTLKEVAKILM